MRKCLECNGTGDAEIIGGWARLCDACYGEGVIAAAPCDATPRKAEGFEARRAGSAVTAKPAGAQGDQP